MELLIVLGLTLSMAIFGLLAIRYGRDSRKNRRGPEV